VDDITRFVAPDTVVTAIESDPTDPNYEPLRDNIRRLREATDQDGNHAVDHRAATSLSRYFRRRAPACQLCQFLYRQRA